MISLPQNLLKFSNSRSVDKPFLVIFLIILIVGLFVFFSASFGLLARGQVEMSSVLKSQFGLGVILGGLACYFASRLHPQSLRKLSLFLFVIAFVLNLMVFVPQIGMSHGGATRWLDFGFTTFQPSELLKIAFIVYFASWLSTMSGRLKGRIYNLLPAMIIIALTLLVFLLQKDTDNAIILMTVAGLMYLIAGGKWKDGLIIVLIGGIFFGGWVLYNPYLRERFVSYLRPGTNLQTVGYQTNQSLIAIGSGGLFGNGFGQSIQKFGKLPEPIGDSIFAVAGEEFGFVGLSFLTLLFLAFAFFGLRVSILAPDLFSRLISFGIVILIVLQSFVNIFAMLNLIPMSGLPLVFVSHGGSSLLVALLAVGIVLGVSRYAK